DTGLASHVGQPVVFHATVVVSADDEGAQRLGTVGRVLHQTRRECTVQAARAVLRPRIFLAVAGQDHTARAARTGSPRTTTGAAPGQPPDSAHASRASRGLRTGRGRFSP